MGRGKKTNDERDGRSFKANVVVVVSDGGA